jgi:uncharacterized protein YkwD
MLMRRLSLVLVPAFALLAGCGGLLGDGGDEDDNGLPGTEDGTEYNAHCDAQADWDPAWEAFEAEVVQLVNSYRAAGADCGSSGTFGAAGPVVAEAQLRCAARLHSQDMAARMFFDHINPDGMSPWDRVDLTDYSGNASGENIAQGYPDPTAVMEGWMSSDGHCANIMNPDNTELGVGYYGENSYWPQVMGWR